MRTAPGGTGFAAVAAATNWTAMRHNRAKAIRWSRFDEYRQIDHQFRLETRVLSLSAQGPGRQRTRP